MKKYENYLFDLYGTLADIHTDESLPQLWEEMGLLCHREASELKQLYFTTVGELERAAKKERGTWAEIDIGPVFAAMCPGGDEAALAWRFRQLSTQKLRLFPGATEMLTRLRRAGKQVILLSNAQALFTLPELGQLGLEALLDGIVISSMEGLKKPDPALYRRTLARFGLDPAQTVMVGNDDMADCWGAAQAGLDSVYLFTEQSPKQSGPLPENCTRLAEIGDVF